MATSLSGEFPFRLQAGGSLYDLIFPTHLRKAVDVQSIHGFSPEDGSSCLPSSLRRRVVLWWLFIILNCSVLHFDSIFLLTLLFILCKDISPLLLKTIGKQTWSNKNKKHEKAIKAQNLMNFLRGGTLWSVILTSPLEIC